MLPSPPRWKETVVEVPGGNTKDPLVLYYRDGLECFRHLFGNPLFVDYMDYIPRREYTNGERVERLHNDLMTGDRVWELQVKMSLFIFEYWEMLIAATSVLG